MNYTSLQFKNAILNLAEMMNQRESFEKLYDYSHNPEIVKSLVYELFLVKFNPYYCPDKYYDDYKIIHEYSEELSKNGFVEFK